MTKITPPEAGCKTESAQPDDFRIINRVKAVLTDTTLEFSERCTKAFLMLAAGKAGETTWKHETLAVTIGLSVSQSKRITKRLTEDGHVRSEQRGLKRCNRYLMPWHPECVPEVAPMRLQEPSEVAPTLLPEVAPVTLPEVAPTLLPLVKESSGKEALGKDTSSFEAAAVKVEADRPTTTVSVSLSEETPRIWTPEEIREVRAILTHTGTKADPRKQCPFDIAENTLRAGFDNLDDVREFAAEHRGKANGWPFYPAAAKRWLTEREDTKALRAQVEAEERAELDRVRSPHEDQCAGYYLTKDDVPRFAKRDGKKYKHIPGRLCSCRKGQELGADGLAQKVREFIETNADAAASNGYTLVTENEWFELNAPDCQKCSDFGLVDFVPCDCKKGEEYAARQCRQCGGHGVVNVRMDGSYIEEIGWCSCRAGDAKRDRDPSHVRRFNDEARTKKPAAMALLGRTTARAQTAAA